MHELLLGAGEFSVVDFQQVFQAFDENVEFRLSQSKTRKDRMRWASDDLLLHQHHGYSTNFKSYAGPSALLRKHMPSRTSYRLEDVIGASRS